MVGIELVRDRAGHTPYEARARMGSRVIGAARQRAVILRPLGNVIILMPPLSITATELDELVRVTAESIEAATAGE
jgi:adenosylmethionine-8-amino-7-oxononanoate aminotransferase